MNITDVKKSFDQSIDHLNNDLKAFRVGRANPEMLNGIKVEAYGSQMPIEQVANINVADSTLLVVQPWDRTVINDVVKAIQTSNLGINPVVDGAIIRLPLPPITTERRKEFVKTMYTKIEDAKVSIRQKRKEVLEQLEKEKKDGMPEDDYKRFEKDIQQAVDDYNKKVDSIGSEKEKEILSV